jgi:hypothetical protein
LVLFVVFFNGSLTRFDFVPKFVDEVQLLAERPSPERECQQPGAGAAGVDDDGVAGDGPKS